MNAIEENEFTSGFRNIAKDLVKPKAILCISAHWETRGTLITAMENPEQYMIFPDFHESCMKFTTRLPAIQF